MQKYYRKKTSVMAKRNNGESYVNEIIDYNGEECILTVPPKYWAVELENGYITLMDDQEFHSKFEADNKPPNLVEKL